MGDDWTRLSTVGDERIDPLETLGVIPDQPPPYWGRGAMPDQYGRRSEDDEAPVGPNPEANDLPPPKPFWGPRPTDL